eukprot:925482-Prorocentrum_minimum.AAC.1
MPGSHRLYKIKVRSKKGLWGVGPCLCPSQDTTTVECAAPSHQTKGPSSLGLSTAQRVCGALATGPVRPGPSCEGAEAGPVGSAPHTRCAVDRLSVEGPSVW